MTIDTFSFGSNFIKTQQGRGWGDSSGGARSFWYGHLLIRGNERHC